MCSYPKVGARISGGVDVLEFEALCSCSYFFDQIAPQIPPPPVFFFCVHVPVPVPLPLPSPTHHPGTVQVQVPATLPSLKLKLKPKTWKGALVKQKKRSEESQNQGFFLQITSMSTCWTILWLPVVPSRRKFLNAYFDVTSGFAMVIKSGQLILTESRNSTMGEMHMNKQLIMTRFRRFKMPPAMVLQKRETVW